MLKLVIVRVGKFVRDINEKRKEMHYSKIHTHVKKVGRTSDFRFGSYW